MESQSVVYFRLFCFFDAGSQKLISCIGIHPIWIGFQISFKPRYGLFKKIEKIVMLRLKKQRLVRFPRLGIIFDFRPSAVLNWHIFETEKLSRNTNGEQYARRRVEFFGYFDASRNFSI